MAPVVQIGRPVDNATDERGNPVCPACHAPILGDESIAPYHNVVLHGWCWWTLQQPRRAA